MCMYVCCMYAGKAAEAELKDLMEQLSSSSQNVENDLIRHNLVAFRKGILLSLSRSLYLSLYLVILYI